MSLFGAYVKLKRKSFWVIRYVEISSDGIFTYRDKKEDRQIKAEYKLRNCKIKELLTNNGSSLQICHSDESIKIITYTESEHKRLLQSLTQIKYQSESKFESQFQESFLKQQSPSINIQQTKSPIFQPDQDLIKQDFGEEVRTLAKQYIKKFESHQSILFDINDGVLIYKQQQPEMISQDNLSKFDQLFLKCQNLSIRNLIAISTLLFFLISIIIYYFLTLVENQKYTHSIILTINFILLPFVFKQKKYKKEKPKPFIVQGVCYMNFDYNSLVYLMTRNDIRKEWNPNLLAINAQNNIMTLSYTNQVIERFQQAIFVDQASFFIVEYYQQQILRLFIIKYLFEEDNIEIKCLAQNTQIHLLPCLKQFVKQQKQNPKSILFEYQTQKAQIEQPSIIQSEILTKSPKYTQADESTQEIIQSQIQPISQFQPQPIQVSPPKQSYPPEYQKYFDITLEAKKLLESVYPLNPSWQVQSEKGGFIIHTRFDENSGQTMSRGEGIVPYSMEQMYEIIEKVEKRGDYDSLFDSGYMHKKIDQDTGILYQRFKTIKIVVKSRDFVLVSRVFREENKWIIVAKSIEYPDIPPIKDSVRGELKIAGWVLQKMEQGTKACFITMVDPKGSIPTAIVASSAKEQGLCVEKVKNLLDKRNKK
ncbi:unnamed protein product (macronuclear) [Paramecium tetraurelia]|uniref:START domain-containing protein n=1 Tax=Paramecium tetraurelia TaxID=5888 RepID=A0DNP7_PARTE|nr:uncharacterized protein GSPATT00018860001 [Paramecium tetraurelia]CAK84664.1 unnamed protein product [Paramecium tetraurelia]|eukprot:XP_001452061.1 hypothetical protein (macronuclear) [Paramecium tetraurelia strain d4-2]